MIWSSSLLLCLSVEFALTLMFPCAVYTHWLKDADHAVEWVKGSLLTAYQRRLTPDQFAHFIAEYTRRVRAALGSSSPLFYPFKRLLMHVVRPAAV